MKVNSFTTKLLSLLVIIAIVATPCMSQSVVLNGTSQYINAGNDASAHLTSFTLEAWIKIEGAGATTTTSSSGGLTNVAPIITKGRFENDDVPAAQINFFLGYLPSNNKLVADFEDNNNASNHPVTSNAAIAGCIWTHVAVSFSANTWKLYINGALDQTLNLGATIYTPQSLSNVNVGIGTAFNSSGTASGFFNGRIDEVRIWNIARTDADILSTFNSEVTNDPTLVSRWGFNEGAGITAMNAVSGGSNGILSGSIVWKSGFNEVSADKSYVEFDGTNDYINLGNYLSVANGGNISTGTVEFWFKAKTLDGTDQYLFSLVKSGANDGELRCFINENDDATAANRNKLFFIIECTGPTTSHTVSSNNAIVIGTWYHVALTWSDGVANSMKMYINGIVQTTTQTPACGMLPAATTDSLNIGRNNALTDQFFDGYMDELRIWNTVRTGTEISANKDNEISTGTGLRGRWGFNEGCGITASNSIPGALNAILRNGVAWVNGSFNNLAPDQPTNPSPANNGGSPSINPNLCVNVNDPNNDITSVRYYGRKKQTASNQKFSIILLPDTQYYTEQSNGGSNAIFKSQTNWIANNRTALNIAYVGQLGDCTNTNSTIEWQRVDTSMKRIEYPNVPLPDGIPYGLSVGNHDQSPTGGGSTANTNNYNLFFGKSRFNGRSYYGGQYPQPGDINNNDNHYQLFSAGGVDFLVISLEYDTSPEAAVLDWAANLVQTYSTRKVIVMTHFGINETGSPKPTFGTQGQAIYDKLKPYPNFILFVCGHIHQVDGESQRTDTYNGNTVHTLMSDYQGRINGGNGLLRIMEFDPAANKVSVKTFSPYINAYETDADSQFELDVNLNTNSFALIGTVNNTSPGSTTCSKWSNLDANSEYEWYAEVTDAEFTTIGPIWSFITPATGPLPVTLTEFTATLQNDKVAVQWKTASEKNNSHFEIQRSSDGSYFNTIGTEQGKGNSSSIQQYSFIDRQPFYGISYYRLKQVDIDGKFEYSKTVSVRLDKPANRVVVYPNPVTSKEFRVVINNNTSTKVELFIYGIDGKLYYHREHRSGNNIIIKHELKPGTYILETRTGNYSESQKLVIR